MTAAATLWPLVGAAFLGVLLSIGWNNLTSDTAETLLVEKVKAGLELLSVDKSGLKGCSRIAIGYNANLDLIVRATEVLDKLQLQSSSLVDHEKISSMEEFGETFGYYFEKGSAAERFVRRDVFLAILEAANSVPTKQVSVGGNAALMANRFAKAGVSVLLGGAVGKNLSGLLEEGIEIRSSGAEDEVHLILEYEKGSKWGGVESPRANRFIIHSDQSNGELKCLETFHSSLNEFAPCLVVISGIHLLEGLPPQLQQERLQAAIALLRATKTPIHVELASIGDLQFMKQLGNELVPLASSLGLNEQELGSLYVGLGGVPEKQKLFKDPHPQLVLEALQFVWDQINAKHLRLSRIHFHCLTFHLIVQFPGAKWRDSLQAVAAGSLAASNQACDSNVTTHTADLLVNWDFLANQKITVDPNKPAVHWKQHNLDWYFAPVLVCKKPSKTVGLGDCISTVGLLNQLDK